MLATQGIVRTHILVVFTEKNYSQKAIYFGALKSSPMP